MSKRLEEAKKDIENIYRDNGMAVVFDVMEIINKYDSVDTKALMECSLDEMQADTLKLCALNFHFGTLACNFEVDYQKAVNMRKFQEADIFCAEKAKDPSLKIGELERTTERALAPYRLAEIEAQRRSMIMRQAVDSTMEMINVIKKVVERLVSQGQMGNV